VEYRIQRADDGEIIWLKVFGRWYYNEVGQGVRFLGVSFDITRRKELEDQILEITARTQRQIGQDLHDNVGQEITGLGLMAQTLGQRLSPNGPEQPLALRLVAGLNELHQQVRALARGLVPVEMEAKGLRAALEDLANSASEQSEVAATFDCPDGVEMPDHATSMELYRISQEAVSNALRHGRPKSIRLSLRSEPTSLCLRIEDDGIGIAEQARQGKGLGIRIMEHRAALIGGVLHIKPAEEGGTVVTVTLPWSNANDREDTQCVARADKNPDCG
jgi:signal transduction histidine kinase